MSIQFDDSASQYLFANSLIVTPPFSVSAWFYVDDDSSPRRLFTVYGMGSNRHECRLSAGPARSITAVSSTISEAAAATSAGFSVNNWHHGLWTIDTALRTASLDGATPASDSNSRAPSIANTGVGGPGSLMSGRVAELAIWNVDLSLLGDIATIRAALAKGFSPLAVRPANLVAYFPFHGGQTQDVIGSFALTANGTPSAAGHPRIWTPRRTRHVLAPAASAPPVRIISLGGVYHRTTRVVLTG